MGVFNLYSKRQKISKGELPEVFQVENIPKPLRVQIVHIIHDSIGVSRYKGTDKDRPLLAYRFIHETLCREYGVFHLSEAFYDGSPKDQISDFLLSNPEADKFIDAVELSFRYIKAVIGKDIEYYTRFTYIKQKPMEAIKELNERFKEHGVGFQFEGKNIIRIDSTYVHSEITSPTIKLLFNPIFKGACEEYMKAHEHYRQGRNKECLAECLKAFESTMKIIAKEKGWGFEKNSTAKKLIDICFKNHLVPSFAQNQLTSLQNLLVSGVPTMRNKLGSHGQGATLQKVGDEITRFTLNLCGSNIILLVELSGLVS